MHVRAPQGGGDYIDELGAEGGLGLGQDGSTVICGDGWGNFTGVDPVGGFPDLAAVKVRCLSAGGCVHSAINKCALRYLCERCQL